MYSEANDVATREVQLRRAQHRDLINNFGLQTDALVGAQREQNQALQDDLDSIAQANAEIGRSIDSLHADFN